MPDPNLGVLVLSQVSLVSFSPRKIGKFIDLFTFTQDRIQAIRDSLPDLPWETRYRLRKMYALSERDIDVLLNVDSGREVTFDGEKDVDGSGAVAYFDRLCTGQKGSQVSGNTQIIRDPKVAVNW